MTVMIPSCKACRQLGWGFINVVEGQVKVLYEGERCLVIVLADLIVASILPHDCGKCAEAHSQLPEKCFRLSP